MTKVKAEMIHKVWYRVTHEETFVEITLFLEDANGVTLVAQREGIYDTMEEAKPLIQYLDAEGNEIEFVNNVGWTGGQD